MSEIIEVPNITVNTNVSEGKSSTFDKLFDLGFKLIIPILLIGGLILIYITVTLVIPFISGVFDVFGQVDDLGLNPFLIFGPLGGIASFIFGR